MVDPFKLIKLHWPKAVFSPEQLRIIQSVWNNDQTFVVAGNLLGKDYVTSIIVLTFWLMYYRESCRIITTSVADRHLGVLWGEIDARIRESEYAITTTQGGPVVYNSGNHELWKTHGGIIDRESYVWAMVAEEPEKFSGHHAMHTLLVIDEASGVKEEVYNKGIAWARKVLVIGNPWPCSNFFKWAFKGRPGSEDYGGDIESSISGRYHRKTFRMKVHDSPNVRLALTQIARGEEPTNEALVPGIIKYSDGIHGYEYREKYWDRVNKCVGLDADWYDGEEQLLFPPEWLNRAERLASGMNGTPRRGRRTMGHDSGEGMADSAWYVVDDLGILHHESYKTPDTSFIPNNTIALMRRWNVNPEDVYLDRGGGGKQHADALRERGFNVNTVAFGETASPPPKIHRRIGQTTLVDQVETRYAYKNRRAEMYGMLSERLDPSSEAHTSGFAIPSNCVELRRQLAPIPRWLDGEGRLFLPPKNKRPDAENPTGKTMIDLVGRSPDEADALVLAVYGLEQRQSVKLGVF